MGDFALVCEGVTDFAVIKNVLLGYFQGQAPRKPIINQVQPDISLGSEDWQEYGGWAMVLRYLERKLYEKAFQTNRFVVIQIDTDVSSEYGLPQLSAEVPAAIEAVTSRLREIIGDADLAKYESRFLFAICVDELECWLLPLWFKGPAAEKTTGCINKVGKCPQLRDSLNKKNFPWIRSDEKNPRSYDEASRDYRKRSELMSNGVKNPSLSLFLEKLDDAAITFPIDE